MAGRVVVIGPVQMIARQLESLLGPDRLEVAWHRRPSGLLREPVADVIVLLAPDLVDATAEIRRATAAALVVVGGDERTASTCLALGASSWLPQGTGTGLLAAQVRALIRTRPARHLRARLEAGRLTMDVAARQVHVAGEVLDLKPREFDLLRVLLENRGIALSRDRILADAWDPGFVGEPKTVDVHVAWLRPKLDGSGARITTLRGLGYRLDDLEARRPHVLFVCTHNAGRSQMAAALFNLYAAGRATADSAGTRPVAAVHPEVVEAMREVGVDLVSVRPKLFTPEVLDGAAHVVTMGCGEECPVVAVPVEDWALPDPAGRTLAEVRTIRAHIDGMVRELLARLGV